MEADFKESCKKKEGKAKSKQPLCTQHKRCGGEGERVREREREEWRVGTECSLKSVAASRRGLSSWAAWKHFTNTHTLTPTPHTHTHTLTRTYHQKNKQFHKICTTTTIKAVGKYLNIYK